MNTFPNVSSTLGLIGLLIMTASCATQRYKPRPPGVYEIELDPSHRYTLSIPEGYTGKNALPLVLALHYGGHGSPFYGKFILSNIVEPALRELGAIIVSPDCPSSDWTQPDSESFVVALLDQIQEEYNIDADKVLLTGYSMGGMGAWHFAASYPERFSAAVVMAGMPPENVLEIEWGVPLFVIHGRDDEVLPIEPTISAIEQLHAKGMNIEFEILEGVTHFETYRFVDELRSTIPWIKDKWK